MRRIALVFISLSIFITGCSSFRIAPRELVQGRGYVAGYFGEFKHIFEFKNLDTDRVITIKFKDDTALSIKEIPPGRWAVKSIKGSDHRSTSYIHIPIPLMTIIDVKPDTVTFLGEFHYDIPAYSFFVPFSRGKMIYKYPMDMFVREIKSMYNLGPDIKLDKLRRLSMNGQ